MTGELSEIVLKPIGIVRSDIKEPTRQKAGDFISEIVINNDLTESLDNLDEFSHIIVLYWIHKSPHTAPKKIRPRGNPDLEPMGVFATRSPDRPNLIGKATVKLLDFAFVLPAEIKAGRQIWQIVNEGAQPHEIMLIKLAGGKSMADVQAFLQSPHGAPPFSQIGGFQAIDPGTSGWLNLDLTPGQYVAICHVPDQASGHAHSELGMVMPFTVN